MEQFSEELSAKRKKQLINGFLDTVMHQDANSYYASTADIARQVHGLVSEKLSRMPLEDQLVLKNLSIKDVEVILSYKGSV